MAGILAVAGVGIVLIGLWGGIRGRGGPNLAVRKAYAFVVASGLVLFIFGVAVRTASPQRPSAGSGSFARSAAVSPSAQPAAHVAATMSAGTQTAGTLPTGSAPPPIGEEPGAVAAPTGPSYRPRRFEVMTSNGKTYTDGVLVGGWGVVATSVRFSQSLAGQETKRAANGTYVVVHLIVDNRTSHARSMDPSDIQLKDSQGRTFDQSPHGETALSSSGASVLSLRRMAPNVLVQGDVAYDVPLGDAHDPGLQLLVTAGTHHAEHTVPVPLASLLK